MNKAITQAVNENVNKSPYARRYLTKKFESMTKYPSEAKAQELEEMGHSIDFSNADVGECLQRTNFD
jgi:hypothetical protein